jgi:4-carboxymuconolactone decarboxylase
MNTPSVQPGGRPGSSPRKILQQMATTDEQFFPCPRPSTITVPERPCTLDERTRALVRLGALVALGAGPSAYRRTVEVALAAGATQEDVIDALICTAPTVGVARLVAATAPVSLALGYDIDADLEGVPSSVS